MPGGVGGARSTLGDPYPDWAADLAASDGASESGCDSACHRLLAVAKRGAGRTVLFFGLKPSGLNGAGIRLASWMF